MPNVEGVKPDLSLAAHTVVQARARLNEDIGASDEKIGKYGTRD